MGKREHQHVSISTEYRFVIRIGGLSVRSRLVLPERMITEKRRDRDGCDPAQSQGNQQDIKQGAAEFPGAVFGEPDCAERSDRDCRCPQKRPHGLPDDFARSLDFVFSLPDADHHAFRNDDCIVHQHSERDDQSSERNPLKRNLKIIHDEQCPADRQEKDKPDQQPAFQPHENQKDHDHDHHGFDKILNKAFDRFGYGIRLHGNRMEFHFRGKHRFQFPEFFLNGLAHGYDIAAADCGNTDADSRLAIEKKHFRGRLLLRQGHGCDVSERNQTIRAARDHNIPDRLGSNVPRVHFDRQPFSADADPALVRDEIAFLQDLVNILRRNSERSHLFPVKRHIQRLRKHPEQLDFLDVLRKEKLFLEIFRKLMQLNIRRSLSGQGVKCTVDIAVIINDPRHGCAGRERSIGIGNLIAKLIPDLRK